MKPSHHVCGLRIGRALSMVILGITLTACAAPVETASRPEALSRIQPSHGAVVLARARAWTPQAALSPPPSKPAPMVDLPRPLMAEVITPKHPLQCVPYARQLANIEIHGDAWTWWEQAEGRYRRGDSPRPGSVMVLQRKGRSRGHLAYVNEVVDSRLIVVSHANWLNEGRIHKNTPVIDVSAANDWSEIRLWNTPEGHYGGNVYQPYGFIYPDHAIATASR